MSKIEWRYGDRVYEIPRDYFQWLIDLHAGRISEETETKVCRECGQPITGCRTRTNDRSPSER